MNKKQKYFMKQKLIGGLLLLASIIATIVAVVIFDERDATGQFLMALIGVYLLFTKGKALDLGDDFCENDEDGES